MAPCYHTTISQVPALSLIRAKSRRSDNRISRYCGQCVLKRISLPQVLKKFRTFFETTLRWNQNDLKGSILYRIPPSNSLLMSARIRLRLTYGIIIWAHDSALLPTATAQSVTWLSAACHRLPYIGGVDPTQWANKIEPAYIWHFRVTSIPTTVDKSPTTNWRWQADLVSYLLSKCLAESKMWEYLTKISLIWPCAALVT